MKEVFGIEKPVRVIYNSVNLEQYTIRPHQNPEPLLVHVSNFRPVKRIQDCVRILAALRERIPARLKMVGDGPDRSSAERLAQELGVADYVEFPGKCSNIASTIGGRICCCFERTRTFGLVALRQWLPACRWWQPMSAAFPRCFRKVDGFLCAVGDIEAMAARAYEILTDADLRDRFVKGAAYCETRFSTQTIIPQYEAFYEELTGGRSRG